MGLPLTASALIRMRCARTPSCPTTCIAVCYKDFGGIEPRRVATWFALPGYGDPSHLLPKRSVIRITPLQCVVICTLQSTV